MNEILWMKSPKRIDVRYNLYDNLPVDIIASLEEFSSHYLRYFNRVGTSYINRVEIFNKSHEHETGRALYIGFEDFDEAIQWKLKYHDLIEEHKPRVVSQDAAFYYAPYIPLLVSKSISK